MSLRYEFGWDFAHVTDVSVPGSDDGGAFTLGFSSGTYCHTDLSSVTGSGTFTDFASALETELNAESGGAGTYTVTYAAGTGYTVAYDNGSFSLTLAGSDERAQLAAILGFSGSVSGSASYASDMRPKYTIRPAIEARTQLSDEYEPDDVAAAGVADDGTRTHIARDTAEIWVDWTQVAEIETVPANWEDAGTPPYKRQVDAGTSADDVSWSYQHAFEHVRKGHHPFLVVDSGTSESAVFLMRAEGMGFRPARWTGQDQPIWSVSFKGSLLGRL